MLGSLAVLALAGASPSAASAGASYPLEAVLTSARTLCATVTSARLAERGPLPAGWKLVNPARDNWLGKYRAQNEQVAAGFTATARALEARVGGRTLSAVISTSSGPPGQREATSCEVMDREAVLAPDDARVARWAGRAPYLGRRDVLEGLFGWSWNPGLDLPGQTSELTYVTPAAAAKVGLRPGLTYLTIHIPRQPAP